VLSSKRAVGKALAVLLVTTVSGTAVAQGSATTSAEQAAAREDDRRAALEDAHEGLRLFNQKRWQAAFATFERANERHAAPTLELYMARCQDHLGKLLAARQLYRSVADRPLPADATKQFRSARSDAASELALLLKRIPRVIVALDGEAEVTLDGQPVSSDELAALDVDPGKHVLVATAPGQEPVTKAVALEEGAQLTVTFSFGADQTEVAKPATPAVAEDDEASRGSVTPALVAYGFGGLALGVGIVTGAMAVAQTDDLAAQCNADLHCPRTLEDDASSTRGIATASTVGFVLAGVGAAAGTALLIWRPFGTEDDGDRLEAAASLGALNLRGTF